MNEPEFWEPWHPQVGDRVRVRMRGECQAIPPASSAFGQEEDNHGVVAFLDGEMGVVKGFDGPMPGHSYVVLMDARYPLYGRDWGYCDFAAIELEKIEDDE